MRGISAVLFLGLGLTLAACGGVPQSVLEAQSAPRAKAFEADSGVGKEVRPASVSKRLAGHSGGSGERKRRSPSDIANADLQLTHPAPNSVDSGVDKKRSTATAGNSVAVSVTTGQRRWQEWLDHEHQRDEELKKKMMICHC